MTIESDSLRVQFAPRHTAHMQACNTSRHFYPKKERGVVLLAARFKTNKPLNVNLIRATPMCDSETLHSHRRGQSAGALPCPLLPCSALASRNYHALACESTGRLTPTRCTLTIRRQQVPLSQACIRTAASPGTSTIFFSCYRRFNAEVNGVAVTFWKVRKSEW